MGSKTNHYKHHQGKRGNSTGPSVMRQQGTNHISDKEYSMSKSIRGEGNWLLVWLIPSTLCFCITLNFIELTKIYAKGIFLTKSVLCKQNTNKVTNVMQLKNLRKRALSFLNLFTLFLQLGRTDYLSEWMKHLSCEWMQTETEVEVIFLLVFWNSFLSHKRYHLFASVF